MCGFVALAGDGATAPGRIEAGLRAIRHRGPDGEGVFRASDGRAALGHARLSIIDLSNAGAQPMKSGDGRGVIAYNGETYNYRELVSNVTVPLRSRSDTEVILELLRAKGANAVKLFRGMFALAYWDGEELLLVRDRLGIKPLFWSESRGTFGAASEISALLAMGLVEGKPDLRAIDDYLTYLYVPPPRTGVEGIHELPPAHFLRWRPGSAPRIERYWSVPSEVPAKIPTARDVRAILEDAVRAHLVSDAPVGVFLSGGLDSSSIVALAAKHYSGTLRTFSITFGDEGKRLDERSFARQVAERFGTEHEEIQVKPDVAQILPELVSHFGQPFGNPTAVLTYALSKATRTRVKVALAGDGGDEVLGGYPRYQGVWAAEAYAHLPKGAHALAAMVLQRAPRAEARGTISDRARRFVEQATGDLDETYFRWVSYLDGARKDELLANRKAIAGDASDYAFFREARSHFASRSMRDAAPLVDLESFLPHNVLNYGDRMSMAHALEVRVPFCDHVAIEQLAPLPLAAKMPGGQQKGLFRRAMWRDLPPRVNLHRKVGFNPPISAWLRKDLAPIVEEYLDPRSLERSGVFRASAVGDMRRRFDEGRGEVGHPLWAIVVVEAWLRWLRSGRWRNAASS